jgi:hypothetical protein
VRRQSSSWSSSSHPVTSFKVSPQVLDLVQKKYGQHRFPSSPLVYTVHSLTDVKAAAPSAHGGPPPGITFDRFLRACVVIKQLSEAFRRLDTQQTGWIHINYDQFMETVLQLP